MRRVEGIDIVGGVAICGTRAVCMREVVWEDNE